jgi:hypothetical protein
MRLGYNQTKKKDNIDEVHEIIQCSDHHRGGGGRSQRLLCPKFSGS